MSRNSVSHSWEPRGLVPAESDGQLSQKMARAQSEHVKNVVARLNLFMTSMWPGERGLALQQAHKGLPCCVCLVKEET